MYQINSNLKNFSYAVVLGLIYTLVTSAVSVSITEAAGVEWAQFVRWIVIGIFLTHSLVGGYREGGHRALFNHQVYCPVKAIEVNLTALSVVGLFWLVTSGFGMIASPFVTMLFDFFALWVFHIAVCLWGIHRGYQVALDFGNKETVWQ